MASFSLPVIMLIGKDGQLGWELQRTLAPLGSLAAFGRQQLDLSKPASLRSLIREVKPDIIVNAAAYTQVDKAEEEPQMALEVNCHGPAVLAEESKRLEAMLVHYSTDYVFDGQSKVPYTEDSVPAPINIYGQTKLAGEIAIQNSDASHLILRTSWIYGARGKNFLLTILNLLEKQDLLRIVADQIGSPTWSRAVAEATALIIARSRFPSLAKKKGLYHLTAGGSTSWHGFAQTIAAKVLDQSDKLTKVLAISSEQYPTLAKRPSYSVLSCEKLKQDYSILLPDWESTLGLVF